MRCFISRRERFISIRELWLTAIYRIFGRRDIADSKAASPVDALVAGRRATGCAATETAVVYYLRQQYRRVLSPPPMGYSISVFVVSVRAFIDKR